MSIQPAQPFDYKAPRLQASTRLRGDCAIEGCYARHVASLPLCEAHAYAAWSEVNGWKENRAAAANAEADRQAWNTQWSERVRERLAARGEIHTQPGTVYYLQVEDKVKIGFTRDLNIRLQAYPPMARLLATHPGTLQLEADMHKKFAHTLAGRKEWFDASDALTAHIEQVRKEFKQDRRVTV